MQVFPSRTETIALRLLVCHGELTGRDVVSKAEGKIGGGGVYTLLTRLTEKGFVESRTIASPANAGGMPRRLYKATGLGQLVVAAVATVDRS